MLEKRAGGAIGVVVCCDVVRSGFCESSSLIEMLGPVIVMYMAARLFYIKQCQL